MMRVVLEVLMTIKSYQKSLWTPWPMFIMVQNLPGKDLETNMALNALWSDPSDSDNTMWRGVHANEAGRFRGGDGGWEAMLVFFLFKSSSGW